MRFVCLRHCLPTSGQQQRNDFVLACRHCFMLAASKSGVSHATRPPLLHKSCRPLVQRWSRATCQTCLA